VSSACREICRVDVAQQVPLVALDSYYYGVLVVAPLNHIMYNLFSSHGPTLYGQLPTTHSQRARRVSLVSGKESWLFYVNNGLLNFNVVYPLDDDDDACRRESVDL
jgi:alpha-1,2-mannosyltransferase